MPLCCLCRFFWVLLHCIYFCLLFFIILLGIIGECWLRFCISLGRMTGSICYGLGLLFFLLQLLICFLLLLLNRCFLLLLFLLVVLFLLLLSFCFGLQQWLFWRLLSFSRTTICWNSLVLMLDWHGCIGEFLWHLCWSFLIVLLFLLGSVRGWRQGLLWNFRFALRGMSWFER